ncbi:hypothetical protein AMTRI_Chr11g158120 [Amborella trichopoda]
MKNCTRRFQNLHCGQTQLKMVKEGKSEKEKKEDEDDENQKNEEEEEEIGEDDYHQVVTWIAPKQSNFGYMRSIFALREIDLNNKYSLWERSFMIRTLSLLITKIIWICP